MSALDIALMISNGADTNRYRDIAGSAADAVAQLFTYELGNVVTIRAWEYRIDNPRVVPAGGLAARSLAMVEGSECVFAILGPSIPDVTSQEITRVFERRQAGEQVEFWLFLNPDEKGADHEAFLDGLERRFGEKVVWASYTDELGFQRIAMTTLFAYVSRRIEANAVVGAGSGRP